MANIETQLESHISNLFDLLETMDPNTEEYQIVSGELQNFYDIRNNEKKIYADEAKAYDANELEAKKLEFEKYKFELERAASENSNKIEVIFRKVGLIMEATMFLIGVGVDTHEFGTLINFEQTGVATSKWWMFMKPKRKR